MAWQCVGEERILKGDRGSARACGAGALRSARGQGEGGMGAGQGACALWGAGMALRTGAASLMLVGTVRKCPAAGLRGAHAQRGAEALVAASGEGTARAR